MTGLFHKKRFLAVALACTALTAIAPGALAAPDGGATHAPPPAPTRTVPPPAPPTPAAVSGTADRAEEVFVIPGNPPIITEGTRLAYILELAQSQPALPAIAVFAAGELPQIARLYRERGFQPSDSPTLSELMRWIDLLGGIQPVKVDV